MANLAMLLFGVTWFSVAVIALRRKLSMIIAIGGGFLCACVLVILVLTLADQPHPATSDTESIAANPQEAAPPPSAQPITEPKEVKKMYYVITPLTPVCSDFKAIVRVEAVVKLQNPQALDLILAKAGCDLLPNELILRGDTPIRSMPAGIVSVELDTGLFFFADYHLTREQLTEVEAQRRLLAANPYR